MCVWVGGGKGAVRAWMGAGSGMVRAWMGAGSGVVQAWMGDWRSGAGMDGGWEGNPPPPTQPLCPPPPLSTYTIEAICPEATPTQTGIGRGMILFGPTQQLKKSDDHWQLGALP